MRKILIMAAMLMAAVGMYAQQLKVVDKDGHGIPLVSVQTEDG